MTKDVYADCLRSNSRQTPSKAIETLLAKGGRRSIRADCRYTEAYGPRQFTLNIDGINIYTKTMFTCDDDLSGQNFLGRKKLKVRSIEFDHDIGA